MKRLVCKTETYEKNGETKNRYQNIGVLMEKDKGMYLMLDPVINLAGIAVLQAEMSGKGAGRVMVSVFDDDNRAAPPQQQPANQAQGGGGAAPDPFDNSDVPFAPVKSGMIF